MTWNEKQPVFIWKTGGNAWGVGGCLNKIKRIAEQVLLDRCWGVVYNGGTGFHWKKRKMEDMP